MGSINLALGEAQLNLIFDIFFTGSGCFTICCLLNMTWRDVIGFYEYKKSAGPHANASGWCFAALDVRLKRNDDVLKYLFSRENSNDLRRDRKETEKMVHRAL